MCVCVCVWVGAGGGGGYRGLFKIYDAYLPDCSNSV